MSLMIEIKLIEETVRFTLELLERRGPVVVNTGILAHRSGKIGNNPQDNFEIGKKGAMVTADDIEHFLRRLWVFCDQQRARGGTYIFEGFTHLGGNVYCINWGS